MKAANENETDEALTCRSSQQCIDSELTTELMSDATILGLHTDAGSDVSEDNFKSKSGSDNESFETENSYEEDAADSDDHEDSWLCQSVTLATDTKESANDWPKWPQPRGDEFATVGSNNSLEASDELLLGSIDDDESSFESEDDFEEDQEGDSNDAPKEDSSRNTLSASGKELYSDWPQVPETLEFLSFWKDETSLKGNLSMDAATAVVSAWHRHCACAKQWADSLSPIVANYCGAQMFRKIQLNSFLRQIGERMIEVMEFEDESEPSLETMTALHIFDFKMSRASMRGFKKLSKLQSFRIGLAEYRSNVSLEDIAYTFGGWKNIRELELWNLNRDCGSRYDASPKSKLWTEVLLNAAANSLQQLTIAFYGKEMWPGVYPSFRYLSSKQCPLHYFRFWLRSDNTDIMEDILNEIDGCNDLYVILIDFAEFDDWSECKPFVNRCTQLLSDVCANRYAEFKSEQPPMDDRTLEDSLKLVIGKQSLAATETYGYGDLILYCWEMPAFELFLQPSFWEKRETTLSNLLFCDGFGEIDKVLYDDSLFFSDNRRDDVILDTWKSKLEALRTVVFKGTARVHRYTRECVLQIGVNAKHPYLTGLELARQRIVESATELDAESDVFSLLNALDAKIKAQGEEESEGEDETQPTEEVKMDVWLEFLPEDFLPKVRSVEEMLELGKSELRRLCKALCVKPYGSRLELAQRVLAFKPKHRAPALYSADMEMTDGTDDEYDDSEFLNLGRLLLL